METYPCYICGTQAQISPLQDRDAKRVICPICGTYTISGTLAVQVSTKISTPFLLSAALRKMSLTGAIPYLDSSNVVSIAESVRLPEDPLEAIDRILQYIVIKGGRSDRFVPLNPSTDYPVICAQSSEELQFYILKAGELKFLEQNGKAYRLSIEGWKHFALLKSVPRQTDTAFVAMWFDAQLENAWTSGFQPAISQAGFSAIRIDFQEHNEKICDRIIAEIRRSRFVIADFTGQRGGVYYEAGFAMGLGIPVIWTVRDSDVNTLHFDTRQYNHIVWTDSSDLRNKLLNRIRATISSPTRPPQIVTQFMAELTEGIMY